MKRRLDYLLKLLLQINLDPGNVLKEMPINNSLSGRSKQSLDITFTKDSADIDSIQKRLVVISAFCTGEKKKTMKIRPFTCKGQKR